MDIMYTICFKCPSDRLSLYIDLLTGEGLQISVKSDDGKSSSAVSPVERTPRRVNRRPIKRGSEPLAKIVYDLIPENGQHTMMETLERIVEGRGYARNSASSTVSRLLQAGFVTRADQQVRRTITPFDATKIVYNQKRDATKE